VKKLGIFMLCFCLICNVSFALTTSSFSLDLPSDFYLIEEEKNSGEYSNGEITMRYSITVQDELGEFYKDVRGIKESANEPFGSLGLLLLGIDKDAEIVKLNGTEMLKSVYESEDDSYKSIVYLGTTATKMTRISFYGETLEEVQADNIMKTIKLKGMSSGVYEALMNLLVYGVIGFLVIGLPLLLKFLKARKKKQEDENVNIMQDNNFNSTELNGNLDGEVQSVDSYESKIRDDWKL